MDIVNEKILKDRLSILVGRNGSGKTTTLKRLREQLFNQDSSNLIISFELPSNRYLILKSDAKGELLISKSSVARFHFKKIYENFLNRETFQIEFVKKDNIFENSIKNLNEELKNFQKDITLEIYEKYKDMDKYDTRIYFQSNETYKKLNDINSGLKILTLILFNIELLRELLNESSQKNNIFILLDEPECYIHPAWQKKLTEYLVSFCAEYEQVNIVYSTHSPYMISKKYLDNIYIVEHNEEIKLTPILNMALNTNSLEINIFQPIEDSLGFKFDIFNSDNPFITVEGQQEYSLFESLVYSPNNNLSHKIINIQGSTNLSPYILVANSMKEGFKSLFILDADVDMKKDFKGVSFKTIENLKEHFLFIGKEIYTYDEYQQLRYKTECLEDYFASQVFQNYDNIKNIIEEVIENYQLDCNNEKIKEKFRKTISINSFISCYTPQQNNMNFKKFLNCLCKSFTFNEYECMSDNRGEGTEVFKNERSILKHNRIGLYEGIKKKILENAREHDNYEQSLKYLQEKINEALERIK